MSAVFCEQHEVNEEAHRLTAGWTFVLANQALFSRGNLIKNPVILYVYDVDEFEQEQPDFNGNIRILERQNEDQLFGLFDLNQNTYKVTEHHQDSNNINLDNLRNRDALIGIESSNVPLESAESAERFILEAIEPETVPEPEEPG